MTPCRGRKSFARLSIFLAMAGIGLPLHAETRNAAVSESGVEKRLALLETTCRDAAEEIEQRQSDVTLYKRLGGRDRIHALSSEIVRLHLQNEEIRHIFATVNTARLADQVTDFMVAGYGGDGEYTGRDMVAAHAHLDITTEHFLAAGADIEAALKSLGHDEQVTQEVVCSLLPFRSQVVTR